MLGAQMLTSCGVCCQEWQEDDKEYDCDGEKVAGSALFPDK